MNNELKCPFCQQELEEETFSRGRVFVSCNNPNCIISDWGGCSKQIITELIRTRKALDVAVDALKSVRRRLCEMKDPSGATILRMACESATIVKNALEQITAEQKD